MAAGVQNAWSTTAASNDSADTNVNFLEGQAPSTVNNSARAVMAAIKKWVKDWQGGLVTGGSSTAYTLTTNETLTLADGVKVTCRMHATSGATPTLNVDSTGAVAIQSVQGTAIPTGALLVGGIYTFTYYASSAAWIVHGQALSASSSVSGLVELATVAEAGTGTDTARAVTPAGLFPAAADVASDATCNIGAAASSKVRITGTTTITAFDTVAAGLYREGYFADALTFTHGAALLLPGGANITTAANDRFGALSLGSGNWVVLWYTKASGAAVLQSSQAQAEAGSDSVTTMTPQRVRQAMPARAYAEYTGTDALTTAIPFDDTIPQNTEGTEILTASITPKSASNSIRVRFTGTATWSVDNSTGIVALFRDSVANALQVTWHIQSDDSGGAHTVPFTLEYLDAPSTTSAVTYKIRAGLETTGTMRWNADGSSRKFGGVAKCTLTLEEVFP